MDRKPNELWRTPLGITVEYLWYRGVYSVRMRVNRWQVITRSVLDENGISSQDYIWGTAANLIRDYLLDKNSPYRR